MKNFDRGNKRSFGGGGFEKRDFGGSRGGFSERKEMFPAVCSECGNGCEVPFRPSGSKPVFCSDCFRGHDAPAPRGGRDRDFSAAPRKFQERPAQSNFAPAMKDNLEERLTAVHNKLDKITDILNSLQRTQESHKDEKSKLVKVDNVLSQGEIKSQELKLGKKIPAKKGLDKKKTLKKASVKTKVPAKKNVKK